MKTYFFNRPGHRAGPGQPMASTRLSFHQENFSILCVSALSSLISAMASKLLSHSHLRAIYSSNTRILSPRFPNPTRATRALLNLRPFSDASSAPPPETPQSHNNTINDTGMGRDSTPPPSSLKELELAKFASIAETWSAFKLNNLFSISFSCYCLFGWWDKRWEIERN